MSGDAELEGLLTKRRGPFFDSALAQLLRAYDSDIETAQFEWQTRTNNDRRCPVDATSMSDWDGARAKAPGRPGPLSEAVWSLPASRSVHHKHADPPVEGQSEAIDSAIVPAMIGVGQGLAPTSYESRSDGSLLRESMSRDTAGSMQVKRSLHDHHKLHLKRLVADNNEGKCVLERIVRSFYFEAVSAGTILFFCLLAALEMQKEGLYLGYELGWPYYREPQATGWPTAGGILFVLTFLCGVVLTLEVIVRLVATRCDFFCDAWNYFDILILLAWCSEVAWHWSFLDVRALRSLRFLRLLRFIRLFGFIKQLESLYFLMQAMHSSLRILAWCSLFLFAIQTMTAFLISEILFAFYFHDTNNPLEERIEVFEYFGSFSRSLLTTFEMAMGNWPIPARVLFENVSEWFIVLFLSHKMTVGFAVLGVINAVFVQETLQLATFDDVAMVMRKRKQADAMKQKLHLLFRAADNNEDGRLSRDEFAEILQHNDVRLWLASMDFDCNDPHALFDLLDRDCGGELSAEQFFVGMTTLRGHARAMDLMCVIDEVKKLRMYFGDGEAPASPVNSLGRVVSRPLHGTTTACVPASSK